MYIVPASNANFAFRLELVCWSMCSSLSRCPHKGRKFRQEGRTTSIAVQPDIAEPDQAVLQNFLTRLTFNISDRYVDQRARLPLRRATRLLLSSTIFSTIFHASRTCPSRRLRSSLPIASLLPYLDNTANTITFIYCTTGDRVCGQISYSSLQPPPAFILP